jgi:hypothetical protein
VGKLSKVRLMVAVAVLSALMLVSLTQASAMTNAEIEPRAAAILFSQYETVFYTNADLSSSFSFFKGLSRETAGMLSVPFSGLIDGLDALDPHASAEILAQSTAVLMGGRGFIPPEGSGAAQVSHFCFIVGFGARGRPDFQRYAIHAAKIATTSAPVWTWYRDSRGPGDAAVTFYAGPVGDSYLLLSNDLGDLQAVGKQLTSSEEPSIKLSNIRDWSVVSKYEYWGYRRPLQAPKKGTVALRDLFPEADALVIFCNVNERTAALRLYGAKRADGGTPRMTGEAETFSSSLTFKPESPGVWAATAALSGDRAWGGVASLIGLFGFELII